MPGPQLLFLEIVEYVFNSCVKRQSFTPCQTVNHQSHLALSLLEDYQELFSPRGKLHLQMKIIIIIIQKEKKQNNRKQVVLCSCMILNRREDMGVGTLQSLPIVFIQLASFLESPLLSPLLLTETPFPPLLPLYCFPSQSPVCPPQDASKSHQAMVGQVMSYGLFPTSPTRAEEPSQSLRCVC